MTGVSYVMDERIGFMIKVNLLNFVRWYIQQIVLRLKTHPWAALRLFILMPFALLQAGIMIPAFGKLFIIQGGILLA